MKIKLVEPGQDRNYCLHFEGSTIDIMGIRPILIASITSGILNKAKPFLQGDSSDWLMVEFWTNDIRLINESVNKFLETYNLSLGGDHL
jgi:hypothetical protein